MNPSGRVTMTTTSQSMSRLHIFNHGEDPRVVNEGDLLIVSENGLREAGQKSQVDFELTIRGRDMFIFAKHVEKALKLWDEKIPQVPVWLSNDEYKFDPITVAMVGDGSTKKGAKLMKHMVKELRKHKNSNGNGLPPKAKHPIQYIKARG